jgi:hypothetical protein
MQTISYKHPLKDGINKSQDTVRRVKSCEVRFSECGFLSRTQLGHIPVLPRLSGTDPFGALSHEFGGPSALHENSGDYHLAQVKMPKSTQPFFFAQFLTIIILRRGSVRASQAFCIFQVW